MNGPPMDRDELVDCARDALNHRSRVLGAERQTADASRAKEIDAEQDAIEGRLAEILYLPPGDLERMGEPIPAAVRTRSVLTADGFRIETVDEGKRVVCRCWREGEKDEAPVRIEIDSGPYIPYVTVPIEQIEHTAWCMASGPVNDEKQPL